MMLLQSRDGADPPGYQQQQFRHRKDRPQERPNKAVDNYKYSAPLHF